MREQSTIDLTRAPVTRRSLSRELSDAGVANGDLLLSHVGLSKIGWVCGAEVAVVQALLDAVGSSGTLVMPAHSANLSDPSTWVNPAVPEGWWETIREQLPAFDPDTTPTVGIGRVAELFRRWPGSLRSSHPVASFAANGPLASQVLSEHSLDFGLGEGSPIARLYELDAKVLLLACGFDSCTAFHLAEYRAFPPIPERRAAPIIRSGGRRWVEYSDIHLDADVFEHVGRDFERSSALRLHTVGAADVRVFSLRSAVDFAVSWIRENGR